MEPVNLVQEFEFIRDRLEKIARLLVLNEQNNNIEAAFMIGCLHSICHNHAEKYKDN